MICKCVICFCFFHNGWYHLFSFKLTACIMYVLCCKLKIYFKLYKYQHRLLKQLNSTLDTCISFYGRCHLADRCQMHSSLICSTALLCYNIVYMNTSFYENSRWKTYMRSHVKHSNIWQVSFSNAFIVNCFLVEIQLF